jgi:alpha-N-arabinofuranosidase
MREKYHGIKIIACGSGAMSKQALSLDTSVITKAAEYVEMISIHYYEELNKYQSGINDWKQFVAGLTKMIQSSANPKMKIFWSEWNLTNTDMRTGLYAGALLNEMEKDTMISMAAPALWLRHVSATGWNNALINFDQSGYFTAPNYVVMKLWRDHFAPNLIELQEETGDLNVVATKSADDKHIFLKMVNPTDKFMSLAVKVLAEVNDADFQSVSAPSLTDGNTMQQPNKIKPESRYIDFGGKTLSFSIPAYSASVLSVHLK